MLCVLNKLRLLAYLCTPSGLSLSNLRYFVSIPKGAVAFCCSPFCVCKKQLTNPDFNGMIIMVYFGFRKV